MIVLTDNVAVTTAKHWFEEAAEMARQATCRNSRCGAVIVLNGRIIGRGFNGPPHGNESNRTCNRPYVPRRKPRFDQTCCVHSEIAAVMDALEHHPKELPGSRLYFIRISDSGDMMLAGEPYCTQCSRITMHAGVAEFALWQEEGIAVWPLDEYDRDSYAYFAAA